MLLTKPLCYSLNLYASNVNGGMLDDVSTHFTCFTSTKVQILAQNQLIDTCAAKCSTTLVLNLLALLLQKYKY